MGLDPLNIIVGVLVLGSAILPVRVQIPTALRQYVGNKEMVELDGTTVKDVLELLTKSNDSLRRHLLDKEGKLRNFVNLYVNEENIRYLQGESTRLKDGDTVTIIPAIAGGFKRSQVN